MVSEAFPEDTDTIAEKTLGPEHPNLARDRNNLALLYTDQGKFEEAKLQFQRALQIARNKLGSIHPTTILIRKNYARFLEEKKQRNVGKFHG